MNEYSLAKVQSLKNQLSGSCPAVQKVSSLTLFNNFVSECFVAWP